MKCDAEFGPEGLRSIYRYKLGRDWSGESQRGLFALPAIAPDCARCGCFKESHIPRDCTAMKSVCLACGDCPDYVLPFKYALFIMLNPSTADHQNDDPTVAKCIRLARRWGFQGLQVRNIFAVRGSDPAIIKRVDEPTGGVRNDAAIIEAAVDPRCGVIVAAWGNHGVYNGRSLAVRRLLQETGRPVCCFRISGQGEPEHPLYQRERDLGEMERWRDGAIRRWTTMDQVHVHQGLENLLSEYKRLNALINTPEIIDFTKAVEIEAAHQRERWGSEHDEGKTAADWFWLLGYLAGKALASDKAGDQEKLLHHIITTAAACCNWHAQVLGACDMRPGLPAEKVQGASSAALSSAMHGRLRNVRRLPEPIAVTGHQGFFYWREGQAICDRVFA